MRSGVSRAAALVLAGVALFLLWRGELAAPGGDAPAGERSEPPTAPPGTAVVALAGRGGGRATPRPESPEPDAARGPGAGAPDRAAETVDPRDPFQGFCVGEDGRPVSGATVQVMRGWEGGGDALPAARTGADGWFAIPAPPDVRDLRVRAFAAGLVAGRADEEVERGKLARIVLRPAIEVRVRVVERDEGAAVGGARVALFAGKDNAGRDYGFFTDSPPTEEASTDDLGRAFLHAPAGPCAVLVRAPKRPPRLVQWLHVPPAGLDLTVVAERGTGVAGRVVDLDERPIVGALVRATSRLGWSDEARTDAEGLFHLEGPPPPLWEPNEGGGGSLLVLVEADGHPVHAFQWPLRSSWPEPLVLRLGRAVQVSGTITARRGGTFPPGSTVRLVPDLHVPEGVSVPALPAPLLLRPDGSFRFDDVGVFPVTVVIEDAEGNGLPADFTLTWLGGGAAGSTPYFDPVSDVSEEEPPGTPIVRLRVLDSAGAVLPGIPVEILVGGGGHLLWSDCVTTDVAGRVGVRRTDGDELLGIAHPKGLPVFTFRAPLPADGVEASVQQPAGRVRGRVRRLDGPGAQVRLAIATNLGRFGKPFLLERVRVPVAADGSFAIEGLGEDDYMIDADSPFTLVCPPPVRPGTDLDLLAVTPAEAASLLVEVRFERPEGSEVAAASLGLDADGDESYAMPLRAAADPDVWTSVRPVPPGTYHATVRATGYVPVTVPSVRIDGVGRPPRITVPLSE